MARNKVLVVEPDETLAEEIAEALSGKGFELTVVDSHFKGLTRLEEGSFPLVLVSADDSGIDGMEFCRIYRKRQAESGQDLSYLVLLVHDWQRVSICENRAQAHDFVVRPWLDCELEWRIEAGMNILREMNFLRQMIYLDPDTGALNKMGIQKVMREEVNRLGRKHGWLSIAVLDFQNRDLMEISQGRDTVSQVKKQVLRFLNQSLRNYDHLGQIDNERICILSGDCNNQCFTGLLQRIDQCLKSPDFSLSVPQQIDINFKGIVQSVMVDSVVGGSEKCFEHLWTWVLSTVNLPHQLENRISYLNQDGLSNAHDHDTNASLASNPIKQKDA